MTEEKNVREFAARYGVEEDQARQYLDALEVVGAAEQKCLGAIFAAVESPVVELGAGAGEFTRELLERYVKPVGRLYAVERIDTAAQKLKEAVSDPRLEVINSDSRRLPLPDGSAGLVVSRAALHDFVSDDGDVLSALRDCVRVLAPGGVFLVYDKIIDGFTDVEQESAEGRMERINVELAALEGKRCWGLHRIEDYCALLGQLGLRGIKHHALKMPDMPGYVNYMRAGIEKARPGYLKRWGEGVNQILNALYADFERTPNKALPLAIMWGQKP